MVGRSSVDPDEVAADFVLAEPLERIEELALALDAKRLTPGASRPRVAQAIVLGGDSLDRTMCVLEAWRDEPEAGWRLARALRAQARIRATTASEGVRAELVWTGVKPPGSPLRNTAQVLSELIERAEHHVVVLAYILWLRHGEAASVLRQLSAARSRGALVTFVVDRRYSANGQDGHNLVQLRDLWPPGTPKPAVYSWGDEEDDIAKLHAKLVVVDRADMLVTSANLTAHGIAGNLELGVRVEGRPAEHAHDHVLDLIRAEVFRKEDLW